MMRIIVLAFFLLIAVIALAFSLLNFHLVEINLYITSIKIPLAVALTIELFAGIFIGFLAAFIHILKLKSQYRVLSKKITKTKTGK
ncbi:lipopolysaccharide assembly protein LapA domain-containing protein [methanotrophic endosymbiont of Bathymodiolus puteoserpentis (Logatchev)]|uniref:lipopolysaccharide assembly protein LapA domain-containing protein n=1 Tax=methanotrophic endosymbiont of Bathymodiolus puteoserpentis (Logatchev) TaxID=343235 RepID=UPI00157A5F88|nr:LapA family protein [methanotrophic endosymbiont of Bathymodiolus puteoserpentis (Logatchev)]